MKKIVILFSFGLILMSCGGGNSHDNAPDPYEAQKTSETETPSYDPQRGEGKFKDVVVSEKLDAALATNGEKIVGVKCGSCHKLTNEKLVGPGWQGVTTRRTAEWIMNFITNTDAMLDKDPEASST